MGNSGAFDCLHTKSNEEGHKQLTGMQASLNVAPMKSKRQTRLRLQAVNQKIKYALSKLLIESQALEDEISHPVSDEALIQNVAAHQQLVRRIQAAREELRVNEHLTGNTIDEHIAEAHALRLQLVSIAHSENNTAEIDQMLHTLENGQEAVDRHQAKVEMLDEAVTQFITTNIISPGPAVSLEDAKTYAARIHFKDAPVSVALTEGKDVDIST